MFSADKIKKLTGLKDVTVLEKTDSTNTFLKNCAETKKHGALVIAESQTKGRGRMDRTFVSHKNGLYMSILLKPKNNADITKVTAMAAVAVLRTVKKFTQKEATIKWVNDIFVCGKKVSGILTEGIFSGSNLEYLVLGIGVNLVKPQNGLDESIKDIAGYLFEKDTGKANEFVAEIINQFFNIFSGEDYVSEYRANSLLTGKNITYIKDGISYQGRVLDIDENCNLVVMNKNGKTNTLFSGEITINGF